MSDIDKSSNPKSKNDPQLRGDKFFALLDSSTQPVLGDGAMGTMLNARGVGFDQCFDALNLENPSLVAEIHREAAFATSQRFQA